MIQSASPNRISMPLVNLATRVQNWEMTILISARLFVKTLKFSAKAQLTKKPDANSRKINVLREELEEIIRYVQVPVRKNAQVSIKSNAKVPLMKIDVQPQTIVPKR